MSGSEFDRTEQARARLPTEAMLALQHGRKIEAIRIVREQTGLGLAEAKALVDRAERNSEPELPAPPTKEDYGLLRLVLIIVVLAGVAAAVWFL